ncbi:MAG: AcrB/AcrD/AcrF family protein [Bacteroidetes bacterium]|nr:MAG: AcrB/AcrD/AcrF family protein [Bacteroidota bacterium]
MLNSTIRFFLNNQVAAWLLFFGFLGWGLATAPFDFNLPWLPKDPVAVDAIPDIGENQQIVFTKWPGRSPQDVEDQISYPLTTALLGIPGVKTIRSNSMFGFSSVYVIFNDDVDFYWSRSRILEKLNALPPNTLPEGIQPSLGSDATALGQIYWYTLEGRDENGDPTGGWDLHELRSIQDFYVRYGLSSADGVSEVASIGGYVREYQIDVDPDAMKAQGVSLAQVMTAVKNSNLDIGAQTLEINQVEYFVRGLGHVKNISDIEESVILERNNVPVRIKDIARVNLGPQTRRGALDKSGAEAVGGVVVARYGSNPMQVIKNVKKKIAELEPGLPQKTLADGTVSQIKIVPFYDRTQLINETLGTLKEALTLEILITVIVVILMLLNLKSSLLVSGTLPLAVLMVFIAMRYFGVDANIVALSGIAIAIGTMVDMGIVLTESIINRMKSAPPDEPVLTSIYEATTEVASAVVTAVATTIVSFLPVFTMEAAEGKLFKPLAFTKTFALMASIVVAITVLPSMASALFSMKSARQSGKLILNGILMLGGGILFWQYGQNWGIFVLMVGLVELISNFIEIRVSESTSSAIRILKNIFYGVVITWFLAYVWMPLGVSKSVWINFIFVASIVALLITFFFLVIHFYEKILGFLLRIKIVFLIIPALLVWSGLRIMQNTGEEFMPSLDEGSFLLMPTSMPHSGMQENIKNLRLLDMAVTAIPEIETVVGKLGRVESALDPAPISMYENVILYKSEYKTDEKGHRARFKVDKDGNFIKDGQDELIPDENGQYFRQWRDHIISPDDIWEEIIKVTKLPGVTSAPKLQPIETRLVMLQTGMRAPMGIKIFGPDLSTIQSFGIELENYLKAVEGVKDAAVFADRIVGKPYLEIALNRNNISRYGLSVAAVQSHIQSAIGGMKMTETVEGRERYPIRVRYPRELRQDPDAIKNILVTTPSGNQIPLGSLVTLQYEQGPQSIKSENGFLMGYVLFDKEDGYAEVDVVNSVRDHLEANITSGNLKVPPGINYRFAGNFEQQVRASNRLKVVIPVALLIIFLILYFEFRSVAVTSMVFTGVFVAFAGGFIMIWLYGQSWFMDFNVFGTNMQDLLGIKPLNLSVAVWVGFLALFGIATDDGVLVASFLKNSFKKNDPKTIPEIRAAVIEGGKRRVRPAMMTSATTILALLPVLTSTGRGADIMIPMAIPSFGGMVLAVITMFVVPVLYSGWEELKLKWRKF